MATHDTRRDVDRTNVGARHDRREDYDRDQHFDRDEQQGHDRNEDPITGEPGAHPLGSGVGAAVGGAGGAAAGAAAGAAIGGAGGPIGVAAGAILGGLVGGLAGKGVAEWIDPTEEHAYWRDQYRDRDYTDADRPYETYAPAYQYGWESYSRHGRYGGGQAERFEEVEPNLASDWDRHRNDQDLTWEQARPAARDAWDRAHTRGSGAAPTTTGGQAAPGTHHGPNATVGRASDNDPGGPGVETGAEMGTAADRDTDRSGFGVQNTGIPGNTQRNESLGTDRTDDKRTV